MFSTGAYGYPIEDASLIALQAIRDFIEENADRLDLVEVVAFSDSDYRTYRRAYAQVFKAIDESVDSSHRTI